MSSPFRLLVLGAGGFLGRRVLRRAAEHPEPRLLASGSGRAPRPAAAAEDGWHPLDLEEGPDAGPESPLLRFLDRHRPDAILSAAACSRMGECTARPGRAERLNALVPARLAAWCAGNDARLVHVSTDLVFGGRPAPPAGFDEDEPPAPLSAYGRSKALGEAAVLESGANALVVRLPLLFGESEGTGAGASDPVREALAAGERPRLFADEWRTPLDVDDAARALLELVLGEHRGVLHVAGPERLSRVELGLLVLRASGLGPDEARERVEVTTRAEAGLDAERPADCSLDARRARAILRTPLRSPAEALGGSA